MSSPQPPKAPIANWIKWLGVLALGAIVGMGTVFTDATFPGWWDVVRHAGGGMASAATGLLVTLNKN